MKVVNVRKININRLVFEAIAKHEGKSIEYYQNLSRHELEVGYMSLDPTDIALPAQTPISINLDKVYAYSNVDYISPDAELSDLSSLMGFKVYFSPADNKDVWVINADDYKKFDNAMNDGEHIIVDNPRHVHRPL